MRSEILVRVRKDFLTSLGVPTLKASAVAVLFGAVTYVLGHQSAGLTVATGIAVAVIVASVSLILMLARMVKQLDATTQTQRHDIEVLNQRIASHRAIAAWVENCENALNNAGRGSLSEAGTQQELDLLVANVINSIKNYSFYVPQMQDHIRSLAEGQPGEPVDQRLHALLGQLKRNLQAGAYLV